MSASSSSKQERSRTVDQKSHRSLLHTRSAQKAVLSWQRRLAVCNVDGQKPPHGCAAVAFRGAGRRKTSLHLSSFGSRTVSSSTTLMMMMVMMMISCAAAGRGVSLRKSGLCISRYTVDVSLRKPGLCTSRNTAPMELACIVASQMRKCQRTFMIAVEYTHSSSNLNQTAQR